jgi:hypothetical protein
MAAIAPGSTPEVPESALSLQLHADSDKQHPQAHRSAFAAIQCKALAEPRTKEEPSVPPPITTDRNGHPHGSGDTGNPLAARDG